MRNGLLTVVTLLLVWYMDHGYTPLPAVRKCIPPVGYWYLGGASEHTEMIGTITAIDFHNGAYQRVWKFNVRIDPKTWENQ